jgi:hypothetical protein
VFPVCMISNPSLGKRSDTHLVYTGMLALSRFSDRGQVQSLILKSCLLEKFSHHVGKFRCLVSLDDLVDQVCILPLDIPPWLSELHQRLFHGGYTDNTVSYLKAA